MNADWNSLRLLSKETKAAMKSFDAHNLPIKLNVLNGEIPLRWWKEGRREIFPWRVARQSAAHSTPALS